MLLLFALSIAYWLFLTTRHLTRASKLKALADKYNITVLQSKLPLDLSPDLIATIWPSTFVGNCIGGWLADDYITAFDVGSGSHNGPGMLYTIVARRLTSTASATESVRYRCFTQGRWQIAARKKFPLGDRLISATEIEKIWTMLAKEETART